MLLPGRLFMLGERLSSLGVLALAVRRLARLDLRRVRLLARAAARRTAVPRALSLILAVMWILSRRLVVDAWLPSMASVVGMDSRDALLARAALLARRSLRLTTRSVLPRRKRQGQGQDRQEMSRVYLLTW